MTNLHNKSFLVFIQLSVDQVQNFPRATKKKGHIKELDKDL